MHPIYNNILILPESEKSANCPKTELPMCLFMVE